MKAEFALWRLGAALMGGWWLLPTVFAAVVMGYAALAYVILNPLRLLRSVQASLEIASILAATLFLTLACAPTALQRVWRDRTVLRLAPGTQRISSALSRRAVVLAVGACTSSPEATDAPAPVVDHAERDGHRSDGAGHDGLRAARSDRALREMRDCV